MKKIKIGMFLSIVLAAGTLSGACGKNNAGQFKQCLFHWSKTGFPQMFNFSLR